jgi:hypothetical protein
VTDFEPAAQGDARQPVLVVEHTGPACLPELPALLERDETGSAVPRAD